MIPVLSAAEMSAADRRTMAEVGLPGALLMENAGGAVARLVSERYPHARRPLVICGKGKNGGDGFVAARGLIARGAEAILVGTRGEVKGDAALHMRAYEASGGKLTEAPDAATWGQARDRAGVPSLVIDALLGTGLHDRPQGLVATVIEQMAAWALASVPVVAVDLPSGLSADTGSAEGTGAKATLTITFGAPKPALVLPPACDRVGELVVVDIGIPPRMVAEIPPRLFLLEPSDAGRCFAPRPGDTHKGSFGHLLVIAGSTGKTGAAVLAATGALRSGVGLVTVATPSAAQPIVAGGRPEIMTEPLADGLGGVLSPQALKRALALARERDAAAIGPGLGQDPGTKEFVRHFVQQCPVPLVIDADGLNALTAAGTVTGPLELIKRTEPTILTPHPGEMARLASLDTAVVQRRRLETAREFARTSGTIVVLKGQRTLTADKDGRTAVNPTGNPGMATGGTGDVLTGVIGALLCRHDPWTAATAGVYLHGLAGDLAAVRVGQPSMLAADLLDALAEAIRTVRSEAGHP